MAKSFRRSRGARASDRFRASSGSRQYFLFGEPIDTARYAGLHEDREACFALRKGLQGAIEMQIGRLREVRKADPERYPIQRLPHRIAATPG
jgi:hypothetical protein